MRQAKVYVITHRASGKRYIGQTWLSLDARWRAHRGAAAGRSPVCRVLYAAIRKYGAAAFAVECLEVLPADATQADLDAAERRHIARLGTMVPQGYNLLAARGGRGIASAETRMKMRDAKLGRKHSPEHAAKISASLRGHRVDPAHISKMNAARLAGGYSPERAAKISRANKGRPQHPNTVAALRRAHVGAKRSPEACARIKGGVLAARARRADQQEAVHV